MNTAQASALALKIAQTWTRGPSPDIWEEELAPLDHARAEEAYRQLRREAKHPPVIADLLERYNRLRGSAGAPTGPRDPDCFGCYDTGWVTCTDHPRHGGHWQGREDRRPVSPNGPAECMCNIVRPCRCGTGKAAEAAWYGNRRSAA